MLKWNIKIELIETDFIFSLRYASMSTNDAVNIAFSLNNRVCVLLLLFFSYL